MVGQNIIGQGTCRSNDTAALVSLYHNIGLFEDDSRLTLLSESKSNTV